MRISDWSSDVCSSDLNALGVIVGDGWYAGAFGWRMERYGFGPAPRRLRAQLRLDYADGSHEWVVTGPDWRLGASPIPKSDIYNGETIDARLNTPGWDSPAFDAATWTTATVGAEPPGRVVGQDSPLPT